MSDCRYANWESLLRGRPAIEQLERRRLLSKVAVIGDLAAGSPLRDVSNLINSWNPAAIVTVGDNTHYEPTIDATVGQYFHDSVAPYKGSYGAGSTTGNRFWPSLGNHDYDLGLGNYTSFFTLPNNERYYAVPPQDNVQFFVVNSNTAEPDGTSSKSKQATWLKNALAASSATWKLVVFHHPAYTSGTEGNNTRMQWPFQQWGASAVIAGHDHIYERIVKNDFPYFVNGLGGATIVPAKRTESGSQVRYWSDHGAMLIDAGTSSINFKFFSRNGTVRDNYTIGGTAAPTPPPSAAQTLIPAGATWKYLDTGVDSGTAWRSQSFADTAWKTGAAQLGYGDADEATLISYGGNASNKYITSYFRKHFDIFNPADISTLSLKLLRDDGAVVYLNGTEVYRSNMASGTIGYRTLAASAIEDSSFYDASVDPSLLRAGDNVIAVEVHQAEPNSSDVSFDFSLDTTKSSATVVGTPPVAPSNLAASADSTSSIQLSWIDHSVSESRFSIERSLDGVSFAAVATVAAGVSAYRDGDLAANTRYFYRVRAHNASGDSDYTDSATATTFADASTQTLPAQWASADVGSVGVAGKSSYSNGVFTVNGSGTDVWTAADSFRFVYQPLNGDGTIVARVTGVSNTGGWAKAGVMIRESLAENARNAAVHVTPTNGSVMTYRSSTGSSTSGSFSSGQAPLWLKLVRAGSSFTSYRSTDGVSWTSIGSVTISMTSSVYIGLCVAAKDNTKLNTSTFSNVSVSATATASAASTVAALTSADSTKAKTNRTAAIELVA